MSPTEEWVLLAYRIPREPSTPRISVWRKLRRLGVVQLLDGLVALPYDARAKEHLEWIADEVVAAGGEANIWLARPASRAQARTLAEQMADAVDAEYRAIAAAAAQAVMVAEAGADVASTRRVVTRLRRDLKRVRQRDHFPRVGFEEAAAAIARLASTTEPMSAAPERLP
jgi:DNA-binding transcriptional regulator PaaX